MTDPAGGRKAAEAMLGHLFLGSAKLQVVYSDAAFSLSHHAPLKASCKEQLKSLKGENASGNCASRLAF